jgi:hypothetical protein
VSIIVIHVTYLGGEQHAVVRGGVHDAVHGQGFLYRRRMYSVVSIIVSIIVIHVTYIHTYLEQAREYGSLLSLVLGGAEDVRQTYVICVYVCRSYVCRSYVICHMS